MKQHNRLHLSDKFHTTFPKRGTHGTRINRFKESDDPDIRGFAETVDELARQKAQLLIEFTDTNVNMARSYEAGYRTPGLSSKLVRGNLHRAQNRTVDPGDASITQLN